MQANKFLEVLANHLHKSINIKWRTYERNDKKLIGFYEGKKIIGRSMNRETF